MVDILILVDLLIMVAGKDITLKQDPNLLKLKKRIDDVKDR
jgi:hypothetical protein